MVKIREFIEVSFVWVTLYNGGVKGPPGTLREEGNTKEGET